MQWEIYWTKNGADNISSMLDEKASKTLPKEEVGDQQKKNKLDTDRSKASLTHK